VNRVLVHPRQDLAADLAAESDLRDRLPTPEGALVRHPRSDDGRPETHGGAPPTMAGSFLAGELRFTGSGTASPGPEVA
jgi:hypothetical protein